MQTSLETKYRLRIARDLNISESCDQKWKRHVYLARADYSAKRLAELTGWWDDDRMK